MSVIITVSVISSVSELAARPDSASASRDVGRDVRVLELLDREVDAHRERRLGRQQGLHLARLAAGLAQDPAADRDDQARLLGERDEGVGADHAALGVMPAQQRLDAGDAAVAEAHDRLVVELELP